MKIFPISENQWIDLEDYDRFEWSPSKQTLVCASRYLEGSKIFIRGADAAHDALRLLQDRQDIPGLAMRPEPPEMFDHLQDGLVRVSSGVFIRASNVSSIRVCQGGVEIYEFGDSGFHWAVALDASKLLYNLGVHLSEQELNSLLTTPSR